MAKIPVSARLFLMAAASVGVLPAQSVIAAKAGLLSYTLGDVYLNGQAIEISNTRFPDVKQSAVLRTGQGWAEVLIGPCSALRLGEHSSFRMNSGDVTHPRLELLSGAAVVEISAIAKDADIALQATGVTVTMARAGLYRVDLPAGLLRVFAGRATLLRDSQSVEVPSGRSLLLAAGESERFDRGITDALDRWSGRRSVELAKLRNTSGGKENDPPTSGISAELPRPNNPRRGMGPGSEDTAPANAGPRPSRAVPNACVASR
jgi:hypothetical protein